MVKIKRVYEKSQKSDGFRILVDRLWPRGVSKEGANVNLWLKEIAPSDSLRKWFDHDPEKWQAFQKKFSGELKKNPALDELKNLIQRHKVLTLVYSAKDEQHNNAVALQSIVKQGPLPTKKGV